MQSLHNLDAYVTWQGGFDYYFSTEDDELEWNCALAELRNLGLSDAVDAFASARSLFTDYASAHPHQDEIAYLKAMRCLDARWRQSVPAVHAALAQWRAARGLEEFGATGW